MLYESVAEGEACRLMREVRMQGFGQLCSAHES